MAASTWALYVFYILIFLLFRVVLMWYYLLMFSLLCFMACVFTDVLTDKYCFFSGYKAVIFFGLFCCLRAAGILKYLKIFTDLFRNTRINNNDTLHGSNFNSNKINFSACNENLFQRWYTYSDEYKRSTNFG